MAKDLHPLSIVNKMCKYADDTYVLCPSNTDIALEQEFDNILSWSNTNKLAINISKTKEILFHRSKPRHIVYPDPVTSVDRVTTSKLLGCIITNTLSSTEHVNFD